MSGENKRNVRPVKVGGLVLDGKKIYIQSMLNVPSTDIEGSVKQAGSPDSHKSLLSALSHHSFCPRDKPE